MFGVCITFLTCKHKLCTYKASFNNINEPIEWVFYLLLPISYSKNGSSYIHQLQVHFNALPNLTFTWYNESIKTKTGRDKRKRKKKTSKQLKVCWISF